MTNKDVLRNFIIWVLFGHRTSGSGLSVVSSSLRQLPIIPQTWAELAQCAKRANVTTDRKSSSFIDSLHHIICPLPTTLQHH